VSDESTTLGSRVSAIWRGVWAKAPGILGGIAFSAGLGFILLWTPLGHIFENESYDIPFRWRPWQTNAPGQVEMVYLDESSYDNLHQSYTKVWNRAFFTRFLKRLTAEGATAVVFDIVFSDPLDEKTDQQFADGISEFGKVILAADWTIGYNAENKPEEIYALPLRLFNERASDLGSSTLLPDEGEFVRQYRPTLPGKLLGDATNSEAWVTAILLQPSFLESNSLKSQPFWVNYYAPEIALPSVSFYEAIADHDPAVPAGFFHNKIVFVGARIQTKLAMQRKDEYSTPFSYDQDNLYRWMSGVTIHATAFLNLIRGDYLRRIDWRLENALIIAIGVLFGGGLVLCRPFPAFVIGVLSMFPIVFADYYAFKWYYYWFPWLIVVGVQIPIAIVWSVGYNSVRLLVEKRLVEQSLGLYLSPKLVKKFASNPKLMKPGAEKQMLTILFSDIAGFTTISEGMDSDDLARLMNEYFQNAVHNCIHATDGTVVKYIGDAIFAFWNAPDPQGDHAYRACEAALRFRALNAQRINGTELITRIGLHTGVANVGNFGSDKRVDYTAIGENINLASRMEGLNKYLGTRVLITGDTYKEVDSRVVTRYLGLFRLKGFEKAVAVYELVAFAEKEVDSRTLRERFAAALDKLVKKDFASAEEAFHLVQKTNPDDGPTEFYLEQIEELRASQLPPDWKGEIILKDK
jgi:adenylate cyclase